MPWEPAYRGGPTRNYIGAVRRQLDEDPEIRAHDIAVVASDGVITLKGFVRQLRREARGRGYR